MALHELWERGCQFLGTQYAILGGAMTWVSERNLVSSLSNAGAFGVLACGSMDPKLLDAEISATGRMTDKPFGVNLITMHPELKQLIDVCIARRVQHIILAGGLPGSSEIKQSKSGGAKVLCFAPTLGVAKRLIRQGVDAIVIEGAEAGGHIGPVSTSVLAQEVLPHIDEVPVFVAGGIGRGEAIVSYLEMGASGCQLGTLFVCSKESVAHEKFKKAFIQASARDALPSVQLDPQFPVIPVRALQNNATKEFLSVQRDVIASVRCGEMDHDAAQLKIEHHWAGALRRAVIDGDVEGGSLMAGQSVGMVKDIKPIADIIAHLVEEAAKTHSERQYNRISK